MLPPQTTMPTACGGEARGKGQYRGEAGGAGALRDQLGAFRQQPDRLLHRTFRHHQHLDDAAADQCERHLADVAHRDALGDGRAADQTRPAGQPLRHGRVALDLHAVHRDPGLNAGWPRPQPASMPPPPTGITSASSSGASSSISSARVPWPAITAGSS